MDDATILEGTEYQAVQPMETPALWAAWGKRREEVARLRSEMVSLHEEITRRELAEHQARINPDRSLDQGIDLRLDMPGVPRK